MPHLFQFEPTNIPPKLSGAIVGNTLVNGGKPSAWWRTQSSDFRVSFVRTMRTSMQNGEGVAQAIRRLSGGVIDGVTVPGIMKTTRARAGALASTSMNAFSNQARLSTFQENEDVVKGMQQVSTLDNLTSDICIAYSGQAWQTGSLQPIPPSTLPFNGGPPRHFNCRSTLVPVLKSFQELGLTNNQAAGFPQGTRASMDGQVPGDTSFGNFLSGKSKGFQDKLLGPARAKLWRNNDITLTQLVDMRGNPMTLAQLEQKIGIPIKKPTIGVEEALRAEQERAAAARLTEVPHLTADVPGTGERVFTKPNPKDALVQINSADLETGWKRSDGYIPPNAETNTIGNRIKGFDEFLAESPTIETASIHVDVDGFISFTNGRHRTRVLINSGMDDIPVTMSRESVNNFERHFKRKVKRPPSASKLDAKRVEQLQKEFQKARIAKFKAERAASKAKKAAEEAAEEARAARKAAEAARKEAAAARKLAREQKAAKLAAEKARKKAEKKAPPAIQDPVKINEKIDELLKKAGFSAEDIKLSQDFAIRDIVLSTGRLLVNEKSFETIVKLAKESLDALKSTGKILDKLALDIDEALKLLPKKIPVFKTSAEAEAWTRKHLINAVNNQLKGKTRTVRNFRAKGPSETVHSDLVAWGGYNKDLFRQIADVTAMMTRRFEGMRLPNWIGVKGKHNMHRFEKGSADELAAVHMQTDSLLLPRNVTNAERLARANRNNAAWTAQNLESETRRFNTMLVDAKRAVDKDVPFAKELVEALEEALKTKNFQFTVSMRLADDVSEVTRSAVSLWQTIIHESGHRLHGRFNIEVDNILRAWKDELQAGGFRGGIAKHWQRQTSLYAAENEFEFVAEQFTRYMLGEHKRIYPPLLEFFSSIDKVKKFGINNISTLISI